MEQPTILPNATTPTDWTDVGDSGGPVFDFEFQGDIGLSAIGTIVGYRASLNGSLLFTSVDRFSNLNIQVLRQPGSFGLCDEFPFLCS